MKAERNIPEHAYEIKVQTEFPTKEAVVYIWLHHTGKYVGRAFKGKKTKHVWFLAFGSEEKCVEYSNDWIKMYQRVADEHAAYKDKLKNFVRDVEVGAILYGSWGFEQTNSEFYQVIELVGKKSVKIQKIGMTKTYNHDMSGDCLPNPNIIIGEPIVKTYGYHGAKIDSYLTVSKWDGSPKYWSSYY